jgi:tetratricopeptide (TPR) repeat protein
MFMKKLLPLSLLIVALLFSGCASKRLAKRGLKFEQAGMYEMAADLYYQAVVANANNVDAVVGLKKNGQRLLDEKMLQVQKAYYNNNDRETVYNFIDAQNYLQKVNATGVSLSMSEQTRSFYEEAKPRYLESLFYDARLLLDEEKFRESETKFAEIKRIDPNYEGVDDYMKVSQSEPLYREGKQFLDAGYYRKAYKSFNTIIGKAGLYKDSKDLMDESLLKGQLTIAIGKIENKTHHSGANLLLESTLNKAVSRINDPFVKLVDIKNTDQFLHQQEKSSTLGSEIRVGQILAARALLNGSVIRFDMSEGKVQTQTKRGYLKEIIVRKDKKTDEEQREVRYHKVSYNVTQKSNSASITLQYQLSSTETGAVLISDVLSISRNDEVHFATFKGDHKKLVPGYWERSDKDSPKDRIDDNFSAVQSLQQLFSAKQTIVSAEDLRNQALIEIESKVSQQISKYNSEQY